jgi:hypothetical protein
VRGRPNLQQRVRRRLALVGRVLRGAALLAFVAPAAHAAKPEFDWPDWDALKTRYGDPGAVFLLDEMTSELGRQGDEFGRRVTVHRVIAIADPKQAESWLDWDIPNSEFHNLSRVEARTWTSPTQSRKVERADFHDVSLFPDEVLYADVKGKRFAFPSVGPHTVLELTYEYTSPSVYSYDEHLFAHTIPTLVSRARFIVPRSFLAEEFDQAIRVQGLASASPRVEVLPRPEGEVKQFTWELTDIPAIADEPDMPSLAEISPFIRLAPKPPTRFRWDWAYVGRHYYDEFVAPQLKSTPQIAELAHRLVGGATTPVAKVRALYAYVQSDVRYVAVELGMGGIRPHPAQQVLELRYGDCKDKATLFLSLLHEVGIDGCAALVRTRDQGPVDSVLVNMGQFNHMIVWLPIGDEGWWLDPTAEYATADYLPDMDQGGLALVCGPAIAGFLPTPVLEPERSTIDRRVDATLGEAGDLTGTLELRVGGEAGMNYRGAFRTRDATQREELMASLLARALPSAKMGPASVSGLEGVDHPLVISIAFTAPRCATAAGDALVLPGDFLQPPAWGAPFRKPSRRNPVKFEGLEQMLDRVRVRPPDGWTFDVPDGADMTGDCFSFHRAAVADSGMLRVDRTAALERATISRANFALARTELDKAETAFAEPLRFHRKR